MHTSAASTGAAESADAVEVRPFREGDRAGFLDLYEAVWGRERDAEWFDWRFGDNPFGDGCPIVVATADDRIVGAEPCVPYDVQAGDRRLRALQPADWIVHPEYRRQGVFTTMTDRWLADPGDADCFFNFPSAAITGGLESAGWSVAGPVRTHYRINRPAALASALGWSSRRLAMALAAAPAARARLAWRDSRHSPPGDVAVTAHEGVEAVPLVALYRGSVPAGFHVPRERRYYEWRFANPRWSTTTYVARRDDEPVAAVVACERSLPELAKVSLADAQPMVAADDDRSGASDHARDGFAACLAAICRDHADATVLDAAGAAIPPDVLAAAGFLPDDRPPLSWWQDRTVLATRPVGDGSPAPDGLALDDADDWTLSVGERDVA